MIRHAAAAQLAAWDPYDQNTFAPFFDSEWMFGWGKGFDVVIGNPPYVRQEKIKHLKPFLKAIAGVCFSFDGFRSGVR